jgi:hypothetical protein
MQPSHDVKVFLTLAAASVTVLTWRVYRIAMVLFVSGWSDKMM